MLELKLENEENYRNKPFKLLTECASEWSFWASSWCNSGEMNGAGREAFRFEEIFPLPMTYTLQKSGAAFDAIIGTSALNFLNHKNNQSMF